MSAATVSPAPVAHRPTLVPKGRKSLRALVEADMARLNALGESPRSSPPRKNQPLSEAEIKRRTRPHVPFEIRPDKRKLVEMFQDEEGHFCLPYKVPKTDHTPTSTGTTTTSSSPVSETGVKTQLGKPAGRESQVKPKPGRVFGDRPRRVSMREILFSQKASMNPQSNEPKRIRVKARPASWFFNIYIDDEVEEATNLMQHSTDRLEIIDDEGKAGFDDHDKENIPPHELGISLPGPVQPATAASRKNMTAQFRTPLGDLDAADYDGRSPSDLTDDILREHEYVKRGIAMFGTLISPEIPSCMSVSASY